MWYLFKLYGRESSVLEFELTEVILINIVDGKLINYHCIILINKNSENCSFIQLVNNNGVWLNETDEFKSIIKGNNVLLKLITLKDKFNKMTETDWWIFLQSKIELFELGELL